MDYGYHIPVPFVFLMRILSGLNWTVIPLLVLSDIIGQIIGGKLRTLRHNQDDMVNKNDR